MFLECLFSSAKRGVFVRVRVRTISTEQVYCVPLLTSGLTIWCHTLPMSKGSIVSKLLFTSAMEACSLVLSAAELYYSWFLKTSPLSIHEQEEDKSDSCVGGNRVTHLDGLLLTWEMLYLSAEYRSPNLQWVLWNKIGMVQVLPKKKLSICVTICLSSQITEGFYNVIKKHYKKNYNVIGD